jgi:hypothetical protein
VLVLRLANNGAAVELVLVVESRGHHDLRQRERDALAQLVACGESVLEKRVLQHELRVVIAPALRVGVACAESRLPAGGDVLEGGILARRLRELFVEEALRPDRGDVRHERVVGTERRLLEQPYGISLDLRGR